MANWLAEVQRPSPLGELRIAATERGVVRIAFARASSEYATWLTRRLPDHQRTAQLLPALEQLSGELQEYFAGERRVFQVPLELLGTPFQCSVWHALMEIPYGATWTYRELAQHLGRPRALRAVGAANGANPLPIVVPCHRVVAAGGKLGGYTGGLDLKRRLLAHESELPLQNPAPSGASERRPRTRARQVASTRA
jgi:O-6-methylguanine DNA methyltransferase